MEHLINKCYDFMKDCGLIYALCGGYALELFTNTKNRTHSDVDITLFTENRTDIIDYILNKGWDIYECMHSPDGLRKIIDSHDDSVLNCSSIWAIKPDCSFIKIKPRSCENSWLNFEILDKEQKNFDFIEIIFNTQKDGKYVCHSEKNITRDLGKAILYHENMPFLAPEVILFLISDPAYIESDYHREKSNIDFESTAPFLSKESMNWLIEAIEKAYPEGNIRLEQLKILQQTSQV